MSDSPSTSFRPSASAVQSTAPTSLIERMLCSLKGQPERETVFLQPKGPPSLSSTSDNTDTRSNANKEITESSVSEDQLTNYYAPIDSYEGKHRYDPTAQWTAAEEKVLVRKLDYRICAWVCFMFFALQLDRGNIVQALSDNMLTDLHMTTNDYNNGMTIFYASFLFAELPSQMIGKKLGPDNWIPIQMVLWSCIASSQSRITGKKTFYITRFLLGLTEGGFIPDSVLYLTYFYKSKELPIRLSYFWGAYCLTSIVSAFLAFGILHLRGRNGMAGWQWLFALEGSLTALIGLISYFYLPPSPTQTASRFRGKNGWFNKREEVIMVNRILRDDPGKGDMNNRQAVTPSLLWAAIKDYDLWPIYLFGLTLLIPATPATNYLSLTLKSLGFGTFTTNLLTIPAYALFFIQLLFWTWVSEKISNRFLISMYSQLWMFPLLVALEVLPGGSSHYWGRYALNVMLVGFPYVHVIMVGLTSRNAGSVRTRTVGSALYNMCVQASSIISSQVTSSPYSSFILLSLKTALSSPPPSTNRQLQIYRTPDAPLYRTGNKILLGILAWNVFLLIAMKIYYIKRNAYKAKIWDNMNEAERREYLSTTKDKGNKR
ncbi:MAG: hypothetical protein MMC33_004990 [Icmadophila ericetorum]|nr:hypothetical protein [Icmadophila ericetorum]